MRSKDDTISVSFLAVYIDTDSSLLRCPLSELRRRSKADWKSDGPLLRDNDKRGIPRR